MRRFNRASQRHARPIQAPHGFIRLSIGRRAPNEDSRWLESTISFGDFKRRSPPDHPGTHKRSSPPSVRAPPINTTFR